MPETKPKLTILRPRNNDTIHLNQPFPVTGQVTNQFVLGGNPVVLITSVTVQVDAGPFIQAALTRVPDKTQTKVNFAANDQVTGGEDPHTITVTARNDRGGAATQTVSVFTGSVVSFPFPYTTSLWVWGANTHGELGNNANHDIDHPFRNDVFFQPIRCSRVSLPITDSIPQIPHCRTSDLIAWRWPETGICLHGAITHLARSVTVLAAKTYLVQSGSARQDKPPHVQSSLAASSRRRDYPTALRSTTSATCGRGA